MESHQHNSRIWNPNFETPNPGLANSPESRGMTGHKQLRTGQDRERRVESMNGILTVTRNRLVRGTWEEPFEVSQLRSSEEGCQAFVGRPGVA